MIKIEQWNEFVARWQERECYGAEKYLHWKSQIDKFTLLAESANLISGGLDILDISTGMGLWPYVLKEYGHKVAMTDSISEKTRIYLDAHSVLGLPPAREHSYVKNDYKALPDDIGEFDVISSIACAPMSFWTTCEWGFFFEDCSKHLKTGGYIMLSPNVSEGRKNLECFAYAEKVKTPKIEWYKIKKQEAK